MLGWHNPILFEAGPTKYYHQEDGIGQHTKNALQPSQDDEDDKRDWGTIEATSVTSNNHFDYLNRHVEQTDGKESKEWFYA